MELKKGIFPAFVALADGIMPEYFAVEFGSDLQVLISHLL